MQIIQTYTFYHSVLFLKESQTEIFAFSIGLVQYSTNQTWITEGYRFSGEPCQKMSGHRCCRWLTVLVFVYGAAGGGGEVV